MLAPVSDRYRKYLGDVVATEAEIKTATKKLARQIEDYFLPGDFGFVPLFPLSNVFNVDLLRNIRIPVRVFPAAISTRQSTTDESEFECTCLIYNREHLPSKVVLVTTLADANCALVEFAVETILKTRGVQVVKTRPLLKTHDCSLSFDFLGMSLSDPVGGLVGYGLNYLGHFAQIADIVTLRKEFE